jgi:putative DNA methylase
MASAQEVTPFSLQDTPSLIEEVLPVQRLSIDVYKERMAGSGQTLTALGSYWKGRKPLVLNRACILGALLPTTGDSKGDLEIFELLMGMDDQSMRQRLQLATGTVLPALPYKELSAKAKRAEELFDSISDHIWERVNSHLGTRAASYPELVEQLGVMRFGHRPRVADSFSGSGQISFEAARLGCDSFAADLNPIACMLTWGAFNIAGATQQQRLRIEQERKSLLSSVRKEIDELGFELDGHGWRAKSYLYCLEVRCPTSGWMVPLLSSRLVCKNKKVIIELEPDEIGKRYEIRLKVDASDRELFEAATGTYRDETVTHFVHGSRHSNKISSIRGDYVVTLDGKKETRNRIRPWSIDDVTFSPNDIYQERLYAILWVRDDGSKRPLSEYRNVMAEDMAREKSVEEYVSRNINSWQKNGYVPDMRIEIGGPPRYQGKSLLVNMGWTHWNHVFNPRQLLLLGLFRRHLTASQANIFTRVLDYGSRMCHWNHSYGKVENVFYNQALNPLMDYGCRALVSLEGLFDTDFKYFEVRGQTAVLNSEAQWLKTKADIWITDPPYGDAVKYEEILDFFVAWLRKNPPAEFSDWVWDSRRAIAIKGEDHDFKLGMVAAYRNMTECMPDNGLQIIMFTHQSGSIWADMANIVWASALRVTAAWYVVTETDNALREGQYVKGTILLVLRKRLQELDTARDELAYELAEEVKTQVDLLTGLNKDVKDLYRDENLFEDADLQMAGYAAALRVLTRYSTIDGVSMPQEAMRPRVKGQTTMVDELIAFAVNIANEYLVPDGVDRAVWEKSAGVERFYLKMLDMESKGIHVLSNYQNFAKAFKVHDYGAVMDEIKANHANLKTAAQLGKRGMTAGEEFGPTVLRSVLYAVHLLQENKIKPEDVMHQLRDLVPDYFRERDRLTALADYVSKKTAKARPDESSNAMVLRDLVRRERV